MFEPIAYLEWARRFYGKVRFDLATSGIPPVSPSEWAALPEPTGRDPASPTTLRDAIARYNRVPAADTVAALGTTHALWLTYTSLLEPGDEIVVEDPGYAPLVSIAQGLNAKVRRFDRVASDGYALVPDRIASVMSAKTRAVVVTNLHNPTGRRADRGTLAALAGVAANHGAALVVDEVYAPFDDLVADDGTWASSARNLAPNVVAVGSLTKCFGLGAERVGWLLAGSEVVRRAESAITATVGALPQVHAVAAARCFDNIVPLAARARAIVSNKRARIAAWAHRNGYLWSAPSEGLFGLATVPGSTGLLSRIEAAAAKYEVLVAPGEFFGAPGSFRIAWSCPDDRLDEGLERLRRALG